MTARTVLVLGATGFIGGQVARACLERGWQVRGLRRRPGATGDLAGVPVEWVEGDLSDPEQIRRAMSGVDIVFHAAAYYPYASASLTEHLHRGRGTTQAVLQALQASGAPRLVYTSSLSTVGWPPTPGSRAVDERDHYVPGSLPSSAYYEVKAAMELQLLKAAEAGAPVVVVNPTAVFGPGDVHQATARLLVLVARGTVRVSLPAILNVVDVRDVARAHLAAAEVGVVGDRYILGGSNLSVGAFLAQAAAIAGAAGPRWEIPIAWIDRMAGVMGRLPPLASVAGHLQAVRYWPAYDSGKAERDLGLQARPLEETLRDAYTWLQAKGHVRLRQTMV